MKPRVCVDPVLASPISPVPSPAPAAALPAASSQNTLWPTPESFFQVTIVPAVTVLVVGVNTLEPMQNVFAGQVGGGGGGGGRPAELPPPPHEVVAAANKAANKP